MVENCREPTVSVRWDPIDDVDNATSHTVLEQILLPSKWNKNIVGAWRMDVYVDVLDEQDESEAVDEGTGGENTDYGTDSSEDDISISSSDGGNNAD